MEFKNVAVVLIFLHTLKGPVMVQSVGRGRVNLQPRHFWGCLTACTLAICGDGECVKASSFSVRCDCNPGSTNLLNNHNFPCFRKCSLGADCHQLGINLPTQSSPPSGPSLTFNGNNGSPGPTAGLAISALEKLMWVFIIYRVYY
ncbi:hypothetical protein ZOSMA_9G00670 [Zostera marina]|uniref:Uncharacterized protein n=1 Tax=Zostera marina TaxID=29655 RepID=A0A0K9NGS6_ZOSMR|nr:hypothetical protein ZOSMA_9G00670 [Zostera marina]